MKILLIVIIGISLLTSCFRLTGDNIEYPPDLWKGILREAADQGEVGMVAVTCCYRNRLEKGMDLGCVGMLDPNLDTWIADNTTEKHRLLAKKIIKKIFTNENFRDITLGAIYYENVSKYGVPYWAVDMQITIKIGDHVFYK